MPWFPHNQYCWDFWFARHADELHLFYLQAAHADCNFNPEARHDLAAIGHAVMTQHGWRECSPALTRATRAAWDDLALWTGCTVHNPQDNQHYLFYTARQRADAPRWTPSEWQRPQQIGLAVSPDLHTWQRIGTAPIISNPGQAGGLDGVAWRDPCLLRDAGGVWHAFFCARLDPDSRDDQLIGLDAGAVIAWLQSDDLLRWENSTVRRLVVSDEFYQMEVPQAFWRTFPEGKRFYLLFCAQEKDCSRTRRARLPSEQCRTGTYYLHSALLPHEQQIIPCLPGSARLLAPNWYAGRILDPDSDAPSFFGFQWADAAGRFVGGVSDAMPARFHADGTIELIAPECS